jgi:predicted GNAT family acetyltransferase
MGPAAENGPNVEVVDAPEKERYEIHADGRLAGFVTYHRGDQVMTLVHTEIDDAFAGQGLAGRLVATVLDEIRAHGMTVRPKCPFVARYVGEHPEYADLVTPGYRPRASR